MSALGLIAVIIGTIMRAIIVMMPMRSSLFHNLLKQLPLLGGQHGLQARMDLFARIFKLFTSILKLIARVGHNLADLNLLLLAEVKPRHDIFKSAAMRSMRGRGGGTMNIIKIETERAGNKAEQKDHKRGHPDL